jgi:hypothetical protein
MPPPRRLADESIATPSTTNPACASSKDSVAASLSVQLGHSGHTYTVIRLLQGLLAPSTSKAASELPVLCGLNITLRHSALAYQNADGGASAQGSGHHSFLAGISAVHVAMVLGIAASIVGLSLALAMHLAYRYRSNLDDGFDGKPMANSLRANGLRRSSSSFSRHRRRSSQAHDPTSIETNITELQETNPIHRMHSRSSSNVLNGPILFPPPKPQPLSANRHLHRYRDCGLLAWSNSNRGPCPYFASPQASNVVSLCGGRSSSSLHDSVSGSGSGLSNSGSGAGTSTGNGSVGPNGQNGKTGPLQGAVQPSPLNHSRSTSLPHGLWRHSASS